MGDGIQLPSGAEHFQIPTVTAVEWPPGGFSLSVHIEWPSLWRSGIIYVSRESEIMDNPKGISAVSQRSDCKYLTK